MMEHVPQPKLCVMMSLTAEWRWYCPALFLQLKTLLFKYGANMYVNIVCDISAIVNDIYYCVDVTYTIFTNTFVPHWINRKYVVDTNFVQ